MKKYNVLLVHNYYQKRGGEDSVFEQELNELKQLGYNVIIYTRNNNEISKFNILQKLCLPFTSIYSFKTVRDIKKIIKNNKIDIIHVHNYLNLISPSIFFVAKKYNVPIVQTIHNFRHICVNGLLLRDNKICEDCIKHGNCCSVKHSCYRDSKIQTIIINIQMWFMRRKRIYKYINYIFLTEFNKNKFIEYNKKYNIFDESKFFVKPNIVDDEYKPDLKNIIKKDQFIYVGRLSYEKGILDLIRSWKSINKKLIICGTGPLEDQIKDIINSSKLNVEIKGQISHDEVLNNIAESKALIFPSICYEGMPMAILESFSVNTPVIARDLGNAGSIVTENNGKKYSTNEELINIVNDFNFNKKIAFDFDKDNNMQILNDIYTNICTDKESRL